jgi:hypothetical protein
MKKIIPILVCVLAISACAAPSGPGRNPIRECPVGMVLVCESRTQREASRGGPEEEIPEYEHCRCVQQTN